MVQILQQTDFLDLKVPIERVWQHLGYRDLLQARPVIREAFEQAMEIGQTVIEPAACYDIFQIERMTSSSVVVKDCGVSFESQDLAQRHLGAKELAAFVVTIGSRLEKQVAKFFQDGNHVVGCILDAFGSEAVEMVAYRVRELIHEHALSKGYVAMTRGYCIGDVCPKYKRCGGILIYWWSPGYGDWDTREQKKLFAIIDGSAIGVDLGEACMMIPRKSYACVLPIGPQREQPTHKCEVAERNGL